jgi:hypothetical protein
MVFPGVESLDRWFIALTTGQPLIDHSSARLVDEATRGRLEAPRLRQPCGVRAAAPAPRCAAGQACGVGAVRVPASLRAHTAPRIGLRTASLHSQ